MGFFEVLSDHGDEADGDQFTYETTDMEPRRQGKTARRRRRNDDEAADKENDIVAAARQDDDEMRDKRSNMTPEGDNNMATAGCHQGTMEMSAEERWITFELGRDIPRNKMMV